VQLCVNLLDRLPKVISRQGDQRRREQCQAGGYNNFRGERQRLEQTGADHDGGKSVLRPRRCAQNAQLAPDIKPAYGIEASEFLLQSFCSNRKFFGLRDIWRGVGGIGVDG